MEEIIWHKKEQIDCNHFHLLNITNFRFSELVNVKKTGEENFEILIDIPTLKRASYTL